MPVALQGASSRMASNWCLGSHVSASARTVFAFSPVRLRFALSRSSRRLEMSSAVTCQPCAASCSVLPPGAAHRSSTWRPSPAPSSRAGSAAARSCTHHAPSANPGSVSTFAPRGRRRWPGIRLSADSWTCQCAVSAGSRSARSSGGGSASPAAIVGARSPQRAATSSGRLGLPGSAASRLVSVENTPCASRRGPPTSKSRPVATTACGGVSSRNHCASMSRRTMRALASCGSAFLVALSIKISRSTSQRSVSPAIARASALSSNLRTSLVAPAKAISSVSPRRRTASSRRSAARRA